MPMTPGTYLRKRREAAGLDLRTVAFRFATLPDARGVMTFDLIDELARLLGEVEADRDTMSLLQASFLEKVFPMDMSVYERLLLLHQCDGLVSLPHPQVCRECACSWHDPCRTRTFTCAWTDDPELCTACSTRPAASKRISRAPVPQPDWPDAPHPGGTPA